jgi:hypothetical protein
LPLSRFFVDIQRLSEHHKLGPKNRTLGDQAPAVLCADLANADATTNTNKANGAPAALSLSAMTSQYFIGSMMPESANSVQQPQTIIEIRDQ